MQETFFVQVGGLRLRAAAAGSGAPLLYVHGNTGSLRWYARVMDIPGCRATAFDLPNFGESDRLPGEPDIFRYAAVLGRFIEAAALDRPVLVGHSLGGAIAMALAAERPELSRALVLVDSAAPSGLKTPESRFPAIEAMRNDPKLLAAALGAVVPTLSDSAFLAELVADARLMAEPAWLGHARALSRFDLSGRLGSYRAPVLVVRGDRDLLITDEMARETAAVFPRALLETMEDVGHSPMAEAPERFAALLSGFIASLPSFVAAPED